MALTITATKHADIRKSQLIILGDRAAGKTHLTMLAAVFDAYQGQRVLWQAHNSVSYARHALESALDIIKALDLTVTRVSRQQLTIEFGAGCIHFRTGNPHKEIPATYNLHVIDNCWWDVLPKAPRVIRTVCTTVNYLHSGL